MARRPPPPQPPGQARPCAVRPGAARLSALPCAGPGGRVPPPPMVPHRFRQRYGTTWRRDRASGAGITADKRSSALTVTRAKEGEAIGIHETPILPCPH